MPTRVIRRISSENPSWGIKSVQVVRLQIIMLCAWSFYLYNAYSLLLLNSLSQRISPHVQDATGLDQNTAAARACPNNTEAVAHDDSIAPADREKEESNVVSHGSTSESEEYNQEANQIDKFAKKSGLTKKPLGFYANESTLPSPEWKMDLFKDRNQYRTCWVSPVRKIAFKLNKDACLFEKMKRKFEGDEFKAWVSYSKLRKRLRMARRVIASTAYDVVTTPEGTHGMSNVTLQGRLESHGWVLKTRRGMNRPHYLSPDCKIQFLWRRVAYEFELLRQECNGNESKALSIFLKAKQKARRKVSDFIYGGRPAAEVLVEEGGGEIGASFGEDSLRIEPPQTRSKSAKAQITGKRKKTIEGKPTKKLGTSSLQYQPQQRSVHTRTTNNSKRAMGVQHTRAVVMSRIIKACKSPLKMLPATPSANYVAKKPLSTGAHSLTSSLKSKFDAIEEKQLKSSVSTEKDGKLGGSSNKGTTTVSVQVATKPEPIDHGDFIRPTKLLATPKATSASSTQGQIVAGSPNPIPKATDLGFFYRDGPRRKTLVARETRGSSAEASAEISDTKKRKLAVSCEPSNEPANGAEYYPTIKRRITRASSNTNNSSKTSNKPVELKQMALYSVNAGKEDW
jgi:hypothetical protein